MQGSIEDFFQAKAATAAATKNIAMLPSCESALDVASQASWQSRCLAEVSVNWLLQPLVPIWQVSYMHCR